MPNAAFKAGTSAVESNVGPMQSAQSTQLDFATNGSVLLQNEWLEFRPDANSSLATGQILLTTLYDVRFLRADSGPDIRALRARPDTTTMSLFSEDRTTQLRPFGSIHDAFTQLAIRPGNIVRVASASVRGAKNPGGEFQVKFKKNPR